MESPSDGKFESHVLYSSHLMAPKAHVWKAQSWHYWEVVEPLEGGPSGKSLVIEDFQIPFKGDCETLLSSPFTLGHEVNGLLCNIFPPWCAILSQAQMQWEQPTMD
jgi:hypothetical protein